MSSSVQRAEALQFRRDIEAKVATRDRLTAADGVALCACDDLSWLGGLAHQQRLRVAGERASFLAADGPGMSLDGDQLAVSGPVAALRYTIAEDPARRTGFPGDPTNWVEQLLTLRGQVDDGAPVRLFVPVRGGSGDEAARDETAAPSPAEAMMLFAVSRLLLDNVADLGCDLSTHPASTAALLLNFGASDLLVPTADFDADTTAEQIWDAGFTPVHRDGGFQLVRDYGPATPQSERRAEPQSVFH